ncbi:DUF4349 domain-containing protein [Chloroflexota bacterium]
MKKLIVMIACLWLVVALLVSVSCAKAPAGESGVVPETVGSAPTSRPTPTPTPTPRPAPVPPPEVAVEGKAPAAIEDGGLTERMIVRTGDIAMVVNDVPVAIDQISELTDGFEGYVVSSKVWKEDERFAGFISIRVPAERFDSVMSALRGLAVDVTSEDTSSKDVTEEYVDLSAKLHNLEATETQLLRLMEKAETVEDILNVQREFSKTRGEIEQTKARMQYLERTSDTSLITVRLEQARLDVNFTADKRRAKEGQKVQFTVRQIGGGFAPYSYEWDFGDGNTSTLSAPVHAYKTAGSYTVSLTVTDDRGNTDTETRDGYIVVLPGWSAGIIASGAWNGLVTFGHVLANILIWLGIFSPVWVVVGGIIYWWQRRRRSKKAGD